MQRTTQCARGIRRPGKWSCVPTCPPGSGLSRQSMGGYALQKSDVIGVWMNVVYWETHLRARLRECVRASGCACERAARRTAGWRCPTPSARPSVASHRHSACMWKCTGRKRRPPRKSLPARERFALEVALGCRGTPRGPCCVIRGVKEWPESGTALIRVPRVPWYLKVPYTRA